MIDAVALVRTFFDGWHTYQTELTAAIAPLTDEQLLLRVSPKLRSIGQIATHLVSVRARWFYLGWEEGGETFKKLGNWDRRGRKRRTAADLVYGLETTWAGMHEAIGRWTPEQWAETWPGEDDSEPAIVTRQWVIWHLIEHDLHHGGELSITLGAHGLKGLHV